MKRSFKLENLCCANCAAKIETAINKKDGTNTVYATYDKALHSGKTTPGDKWKLQDYDSEKGFQRMTVRVVEYQINGDWVKKLRGNLQPTYEYKPGK